MMDLVFDPEMRGESSVEKNPESKKPGQLRVKAFINGVSTSWRQFETREFVLRNYTWNPINSAYYWYQLPTQQPNNTVPAAPMFPTWYDPNFESSFVSYLDGVFTGNNGLPLNSQHRHECHTCKLRRVRFQAIKKHYINTRKRQNQ